MTHDLAAVAKKLSEVGRLHMIDDLRLREADFNLITNWASHLETDPEELLMYLRTSREENPYRNVKFEVNDGSIESLILDFDDFVTLAEEREIFSEGLPWEEGLRIQNLVLSGAWWKVCGDWPIPHIDTLKFLAIEEGSLFDFIEDQTSSEHRMLHEYRDICPPRIRGLRTVEVSFTDIVIFDLPDDVSELRISHSNFPTEVFEYPSSKLELLEIAHCDVEEVDINNSSQLRVLDLSFCSIHDLDLDGCVALRSLDISGNPISELNLASFPKLEELSVDSTNLRKLDISCVPQLTKLDICGTEISIKNLDASVLSNIQEFKCVGCEIEDLDLSLLPNLESLSCGGTKIRSLDLSKVPKLKKLNLESSSIEDLNLKEVPSLEFLDCSYTGVSSLDLRGLKNFKTLYCQHTKVERISSPGQGLETLHCNVNVRLSRLWFMTDVTTYDPLD